MKRILLVSGFILSAVICLLNLWVYLLSAPYSQRPMGAQTMRQSSWGALIFFIAAAVCAALLMKKDKPFR